MKAEIKGYDCTDHDPIEKWKPENIEDINIRIAFHIGQKGSAGADLFYSNIVTENNIPKGKNSKYIQIEKYNFKEIIVIIQKLIDGIQCDNWAEFGNELNKYMDWEFDNYQE